MLYYTEIYDRFLGKITDYDFLEYTESDLENELFRKMKGAISRFDCPKLSNRDDDMQLFNDDLTDLEQEILSELMLLEWLNPRINNIELLRQALNTKDFSFYSQSNHLNSLIQLKNNINRNVQYLMMKYTYKNL